MTQNEIRNLADMIKELPAVDLSELVGRLCGNGCGTWYKMARLSNMSREDVYDLHINDELEAHLNKV